MPSRLPSAARHHLPLFGLAIAILGLGAALPVTAVAAPAIIYGIDNNNDIYEIDPVAKTSALALVQPAGGFSNALAYDTTRDHLFFIGPDNGLKYWAQGSGTTGLNVAGSPAVGTDPQNAAYFDNAYWFFEHDSNVLHRWNLSYTGTGASAVPSISGTQAFVIAGMDLPPTGSVNNTNSFGDIAINPTTGILYASTSRGRFYSVDLLNSMTFTQLLVSPGNDNTVGLQLSFNTDYSILYGHSYTSGSWYEVNPANGNQTAITGFSTKPFGDRGFRDLGGAAVAAVPEPSAAALACIGVAGAAWCLRRRRRAG